MLNEEYNIIKCFLDALKTRPLVLILFDPEDDTKTLQYIDDIIYPSSLHTQEKVIGTQDKIKILPNSQTTFSRKIIHFEIFPNLFRNFLLSSPKDFSFREQMCCFCYKFYNLFFGNFEKLVVCKWSVYLIGGILTILKTGFERSINPHF